MNSFVRSVATLVGAAASGFLIWLASRLDAGTTGDYWATLGLLAAAGLVLGLAATLTRPTPSRDGARPLDGGTFVLAFLPALLAAGWILLVAQPEGGWQQGRFEGWSDDVGILGVVRDLGELAPVLAFAVGLVFAFCFAPASQRVRAAVVDRDVGTDTAAIVPGERSDAAEASPTGVIDRPRADSWREDAVTVERETVDLRDADLGNLPPEQRS